MELDSLCCMYPECRFVKSDGRRCHSPAMRGMAYCYFHQPARRLGVPKGRPQKPIHLELPTGNDDKSYQRSVTKLRRLVAEGRVSHQRADTYLFALSVAAQIMKNDQAEKPADEPPVNDKD